MKDEYYNATMHDGTLWQHWDDLLPETRRRYEEVTWENLFAEKTEHKLMEAGIGPCNQRR